MRLPAEHELDDEGQRFLRQHDLEQIHAETPTTVAEMYRLRLEAIADAVRTHAPDGVAVDLGCAQGNIALTLAAAGRPSIGIDLDPRFLRYARMKTEQEPVAWVAASGEHPPIRPASAAVVVLGEILEHVAYPERTLSQAAELVRPGGIIVATTPNGSFVRGGLGTLASIPDRHAIESEQFQPDADGHLFLMSREELIVLGTGAGLRLLHHRYYQSPPVSGWPKAQRLAERVPVGVRMRAEAAIQRTKLARFVSFGQLAVFQRPS